MGLYGLLKILLIAMVVWWLYKLLTRWLAKDDKPRQAAPPPPRPAPEDGKIEVMVQDPFCGTYIPQSEALTSIIAGQPVHFCSEKCRQGYLDALENTRNKTNQSR